MGVDGVSCEGNLIYASMIRHVLVYGSFSNTTQSLLTALSMYV